jgi:hypothetical protein
MIASTHTICFRVFDENIVLARWDGSSLEVERSAGGFDVTPYAGTLVVRYGGLAVLTATSGGDLSCASLSAKPLTRQTPRAEFLRWDGLRNQVCAQIDQYGALHSRSFTDSGDAPSPLSAFVFGDTSFSGAATKANTFTTTT